MRKPGRSSCRPVAPAKRPPRHSKKARHLTDEEFPIADIALAVAELEPSVDRFTQRQQLDSVRYLKPKFLSGEPKRTATRWRGYYGWNPMRLNLEFAKAYREAYRDYIRTNVDCEIADRVSGINIEAVRNPNDTKRFERAERTAISKARAVADGFGLPYGPFISFCLSFGERRGVQHVMRPCQLIPSVKPPRHADRLAKWSQDKADRRLAAWKEAVKQFRHDWLATMTSDYRDTPRPDPMVPRGCYGVSGAHDDNSAICRACPFHVQCRRECAALDVRLAKMTMQVGKPQTYDEKKEEREKARKARAAAHMREVRQNEKAEKQLVTT